MKSMMTTMRLESRIRTLVLSYSIRSAAIGAVIPVALEEWRLFLELDFLRFNTLASFLKDIDLSSLFIL
jgi:hypothetical protein